MPDFSRDELSEKLEPLRNENQILKSQVETFRKALEAIVFYHDKKYLPKTNESFESLYLQTGEVARKALKPFQTI